MCLGSAFFIGLSVRSQLSVRTETWQAKSEMFCGKLSGRYTRSVLCALLLGELSDLAPCFPRIETGQAYLNYFRERWEFCERCLRALAVFGAVSLEGALFS